MYCDEYEKILERMKTVADIAQDYANMQSCKQHLQNYKRLDAWNCLQKMIQEYWAQIEFFGSFDNIRIYSNVAFENTDDNCIQEQLMYIAKHIPAYIFLRKGEEELAKRIYKSLKQTKSQN